MPKQKPNRPRCLRCMKLMSINADGRFRFHMTKDSMRTCLGSYETPEQQLTREIHPVILKELDDGWREFISELFRRQFLVHTDNQFMYRDVPGMRYKPLPRVVQEDLVAIFAKPNKPKVTP